MTYLFTAMPANVSYPKMADPDGKPDCLICFVALFRLRTILVSWNYALLLDAVTVTISVFTSIFLETRGAPSPNPTGNQ
jgi:hypothetical protein